MASWRAKDASDSGCSDSDSGCSSCSGCSGIAISDSRGGDAGSSNGGAMPLQQRGGGNAGSSNRGSGGDDAGSGYGGYGGSGSSSSAGCDSGYSGNILPLPPLYALHWRNGYAGSVIQLELALGLLHAYVPRYSVWAQNRVEKSSEIRFRRGEGRLLWASPRCPALFASPAVGKRAPGRLAPSPSCFCQARGHSNH